VARDEERRREEKRNRRRERENETSESCLPLHLAGGAVSGSAAHPAVPAAPVPVDGAAAAPLVNTSDHVDPVVPPKP
jgi:hypothetical protein